MLEVVRLEGHSLAQEDAFMSRDVHLLQVYLLVLEVSRCFIVEQTFLMMYGRYVLGLMRMLLEHVQNLYLLPSMRCSRMMLHLFLLDSESYPLMLKRYFIFAPITDLPCASRLTFFVYTGRCARSVDR